MKILHIIWSLLNGGTENMLIDIINYQVNEADVSLLVVNDMLEDSILKRIDSRCNVLLYKRPKGSKNPFYLLRMNALVFFGHYDIVHLHNSNTIKYLFVRANYFRTVHSSYQDIHDYRWHKGIIAISNSVKEILEEKGCKPLLINNGIKIGALSVRTNPIPHKPFRILQVGRILFSEKGQDILLNAIELLVERNITDIHLDFIGSGKDMGVLSSLINKLNLSKYVSLLGNKTREYVYEHICDYDIYVQPSRIEGFGLTVAEAMAAKIPVLIADNEGPMQIIGNGKYGYYFKSQSAVDCADALQSILEHYPTKNFMDAAYNYINVNFNIKNSAKAYIDAYKKVLENR